MDRSRVKAGRPYEAPRRDTRRSLLKWSPPKPKSAKKSAQPAAAIKTHKLSGAKADAPVSHIAVRELSFLSVRNFFVLAALATIAVLLVLGLVRSNHQAVNFSYEISALAQKRLDALEENRRLKMEIARLTSLDQLEAVAKGTLGMIVPQKGQIVVID